MKDHPNHCKHLLGSDILRYWGLGLCRTDGSTILPIAPDLQRIGEHDNVENNNSVETHPELTLIVSRGH